MMASLNFWPMRIGWMNIVFWTKRGQTQPACQPSKVVQKEPKGTKMVFLTLWDPFGPTWVIFDLFRQKMIFCPKWTKQGLANVLQSKEYFLFEIFQKVSRWVQKGPRWSRTLRLIILVPFGNQFGTLTCLSCFVIFGSKWTIFGHPYSPYLVSEMIW